MGECNGSTPGEGAATVARGHAPRRFRTAMLLAGLAAGAALLRLIVQDAVPVLSLAYYALPLPVLTGACLLSSALLLSARRRRLGGAVLLAGLACAAWTWHIHVFNTTPAEKPHAVTVAFWNVCRGAAGWEQIAEDVAALQAGVVGLVEAGHEDGEFWRSRFPGHDVRELGHGFVVLTRGRIGHVSEGWIGRTGRYRRIDLMLDEHPLTVLLADIDSDPLASRREPLADLAEAASSISGRPVLILEDFNTPHDSVHLGPLRQSFRHAFEQSGSGYLATWPVPLPVLALDHAWGNEAVEFHECRLGWTLRSDHRPLICRLDLRNDASPASDDAP